MLDDRDNLDFDPVPQLDVDLKRLYQRALPTDPARDQAILGMARQAARRHGWARRGLRLAPFAAAALVGVVLWLNHGDSRQLAVSDSPSAVADPRDLNNDGRIDILDAMLLARRLEQGGTPAAGSDLTGDGAVDRADVDAIALAAVTLPREGMQ